MGQDGITIGGNKYPNLSLGWTDKAEHFILNFNKRISISCGCGQAEFYFPTLTKIAVLHQQTLEININDKTMNMFAKNAAKSVEEYLLMIPENRKKDIDFLHAFIQKVIPKLKPYYASNMIGYGSFYYLDTKKQKKDWPIISLANQKDYITIYVCAIIDDKAAAEKYLKELGKLTKGINCIRFKKIDEINLETLKTVLKLAEKKPGVAGARLVDN